jgi:pimeloyl-[acyl-carrier protein] methyl ester esterase
MNQQQLLTDLNLLAHQHELPTTTPTLIIGSQDDIIVPSEIIYDNFSQFNNVRIVMHQQGGHVLGKTNDYLIYQQIMDFLT